MANCYTLFSEKILGLSEEEAEWVEEVLGFDPEEEEEDGSAKLKEKLGEIEFDFEADDWPGFGWARREEKLLLSSEGSVCEGNLTVFIMSFLRKFRPKCVFSANFAHFCDKPRVGEFGGSWLVVTAEEVMAGNTWEDIEVHLEDACAEAR